MSLQSLSLDLLIILEEIQRSSAGFWVQVPLGSGALAIFILRSLDQTASTFRTLVTSQGRRAVAWALGLVQAFLFLFAFSGLLAQLDQPLSILAFAAGYGTGAFLGISIDRWVAPGHSILRIVSSGKGPALVQALRQQGRGVTEMAGRGLGGTVTVILCAIPRRRVEQARRSLLAIDPEAFITIEDIRVLHGGWLAQQAQILQK
ncbi:MAG: DUF2179 domain-containing protein [Anaerolineales bacterium]